MHSKQFIKVVPALIALMIGAYFWFSGEHYKSDTASSIAQQGKQLPTKIAASSAVIQTPARTHSAVEPQRLVVGKAQTPSLTKLRLALSQATDFLAFKKSLDKMADISVDDKAYYAAAIDEACFAVAVNNGWIEPPPVLLAYRSADPQAANNRTFQADDPKQFLRKQASVQLDAKLSAVRCVGYKTNPISFVDVEQSWKLAAATGDVRSIASLADLELRKASKPWSGLIGVEKGMGDLPKGGLLAAPDPSPEHIVKLTRALSTGDPSAIITLGASLSQHFDSGKFTYGQNNETLSKGLEPIFWQMLACGFGFDCSPSNSTLLMACAQSGLCEVQDIETFYKHQLTAEEIAQYERLKPLFANAIQSGDWTFLRFQSPAPPGGHNVLLWKRRPYRLGV